MDELRRIITDNRLVTLTGAGGVGKTRLAVEVAAQLVREFADGVWYVDLAPITDPLVVPVTVARTLGLAGSAGPLDDGHTAQVHRRPKDIAAARQL